ncbi:two-component system sensor histidine kinase QseC [Inhella inkyongensis]|uniref:histidine kinase n=1 Tax=Inhella inkyongensis TaxID=392593 RepID=A0A840S9I4_9BURK|nr:histidine kinase dimerization/phospho-acceptor domain-containing protein [Inhella inkyongensis]MBB5205060.1 two-component system sensor histidine kinase QseC [Inhella inkyongensis]
MRPGSLQRRLLLGLSLGLSAVVLALGLVSAWSLREELDERLDAQLAQTGALLLRIGALHRDGQVLLEGGSRDEADAALLLQVMHADELVLRSHQAPSSLLWPQADEGLQQQHWQGRSWRVYARRSGELQVRVAEPQQQRWHLLSEAFESWPSVGAAALAILLLLLHLGLRRALRPLRRLQQTLAERQPDSLSPLTLDEAPTELQPLLQALNSLLLRMAGLLDNERHFTADAAHELRTPIAALRAQAEVALGATDTTERQHALQSVLAGCERAAHVVDQMLLLARLEAQAQVVKQEFDLGALMREVAAELLGPHADRAADLSVNAPRPAPVRGDPGLWRLLLRNLLDNALRYTVVGQPVQVRWREGALWIEDGGAGLNPELETRLGQRFVRAAGARASGSGLGWSIVQRAAALQGLRIERRRSALGGLAVGLLGS